MEPQAAGKKSVEEELDIQFSQLRKESTDYQGFSLEALRLLVYLKRDKRLAKGENKFNCYVIELKKTQKNVLDLSFLETLTHLEVTDSPIRIQLIVKNGGHFTTLDIRVAKEGNEALVLDAIGDRRSLMLTMNLSELKNTSGKLFFKRIYMILPDNDENVLQKDSFSCPIFSYDHACQASKLNDLFEQLSSKVSDKNEKIQLLVLSWIQMPWRLVRNSQSTHFVQAYTAQYSEEVPPEVKDAFNISKRFEKYISNKDQLATELLLCKYKDQYESYKSRKQYQHLLQQIVTQVETISVDRSMREKLIFIVHAEHYWQLFSKNKKQLPKMIAKMQASSSVEEFASVAKESSNFMAGFFKPSSSSNRKQQFRQAVIAQDELMIDAFYQEVVKCERVVL